MDEVYWGALSVTKPVRGWGKHKWPKEGFGLRCVCLYLELNFCLSSGAEMVLHVDFN